MPRMAARYGVRKSGWRARSPENFPPEATATKTGRSRSRPTLPSGVTLNVRRTRTTWSIQALSAEGTVRLCIGVAMTRISALSSSWISSSDWEKDPPWARSEDDCWAMA